MNNSKDFFERFQKDEAFAKEVAEAVQRKRDAGAKNYYETIIPTAYDLGYEVSKEDLDEISSLQNGELSEEELGKVAGGTSCLTVIAVTSYLSVLGSVCYSIHEIFSAEE